MSKEQEHTGFEGKWYSHPPMRNALIAGLISGINFGLAHTGLIPSMMEIGLYVVAIILGGYHWTREGIEELIEEREIGITINSIVGKYQAVIRPLPQFVRKNEIFSGASVLGDGSVALVMDTSRILNKYINRTE